MSTARYVFVFVINPLILEQKDVRGSASIIKSLVVSIRYRGTAKFGDESRNGEDSRDSRLEELQKK